MSTAWIVAGVALFVVTAPPPATTESQDVVSVTRLLEHLGFEESKKSHLLDGKVISTGNPDKEQEKSEMAVSAVMLVIRRPLSDVVDAYMDGEVFRVQSGLTAWGEIDGAASGGNASRAAFDDVTYTAHEKKEARKVVGFKGGEAFNLDDDEIARFRKISTKDSQLVETVSAAWREVLFDRYQAYANGGLDAIEPYRRSRKKTVSPGKQLTVATASFTLLRDHFPWVYDEILTFPHPAPDTKTPVGHRFFWLIQEVQNRPNFVLVHHATDIDDQYAIIVEQQYYVGHSYNSLEAVLGCVPYEGGTVVFYTSRVFTCQVTGFASGIARGIGRKQIMSSVAEELERLRTALEAR